MTPFGYAFGDTETGGLDPRLNPVLSVAFVFAGHKFQNPDDPAAECDGFTMKILPPERTVLEVPIEADQFPPEDRRYKPRRLQHYLDVYTEKAYDKIPENALVLTAGAVEVNGFIKPNAQKKWDMRSYHGWFDQSVAPTVAEKALVNYIEKWFPKMLVIGCAHNADFDQKFVSRYLPSVDARLWRRPAGSMSLYPYRTGSGEYHHDWFCTMLALQKQIGQRKGSKLSDLAMKCGHVNPGAHEALNDCRAGLAGLRWLDGLGFGPKFGAAAAH